MRLPVVLSALACTCFYFEARALRLLAPVHQRGLFPSATSLSAATVAGPLLATTKHVSQFRSSINEIRRVLSGGLRLCPEGRSWLEQIKDIVGPTDCALVVLAIFAYKPLLRALYQLQEWLRSRFFPSSPSTHHHAYEYSFFGYMQKPLRFLAYYLPFLYCVDAVAIVLHAVGLDSHLKGDVPRLAATVGARVTLGHFFVNLKDWLLHNQRLLTGRRRDKIREETVDELSSIAVWSVVFSTCVEAMKMQMGFALGSVFAVGGIGSASIVLALRSTFENLVGGLLLKLNDKFRVGEVITIPSTKGKGAEEEGEVEEVSYISTSIRRQDNSIVAVPNHVFTAGEIINWSRTPYRLVHLSVQLGMDELPILPACVSGIRQALASTRGVESQQRPLIVAASGFKDNKILIDITCHLATSEEQESAALRTDVINRIAGVCESERRALKAAKAA